MTLSGPDVELAETPALESRMVAETPEVVLELRLTLGSIFASILKCLKIIVTGKMSWFRFA